MLYWQNMIQFYFLSIFLNAAGGFVLLTGGDGMEAQSGLSLRGPAARLTLGALSLVTGVLKLLSPAEGGPPVVGDLFPALTGCAVGFVFLYEFYRSHTTLPGESLSALDEVFLGHKRIFGFAALASAALHFLFPTALLL